MTASRIQPLYPKADGAGDASGMSRGAGASSQRVDHPEPATANVLALADLEGGADALVLVARKARPREASGSTCDNVDDLDAALKGVMLDLVHLRLDAGGHGRQAGALLIALAERRGHRLGDLSPRSRARPDRRDGGDRALSAPWETWRRAAPTRSPA